MQAAHKAVCVPHLTSTSPAWQDGARGLFRGWVPLWARFLPSSILTFHIYEQTRRVLLGRYLD